MQRSLQLGGDLDALRAILKATEDALNKMPKVSGASAGQVYFAPETARCAQAQAAFECCDSKTSPAHHADARR